MNQIVLWICILAVFGIGGYQFYRDNKKMKQKKKLTPSKIIHYEHNGRYACNEAVKPTKEKLSEDWDNVTCKNCRNVKFYR